MKFIKQLHDRPELWPIYLAAFGWTLFILVTQAWPASWWLDVRSVRVNDSQAGHKITMQVDRQIKHNFRAVWHVSVRKVEASGRSSVFCAASSLSDYRVGAELPEELTLDWWTDGRCDALPAGRYFMVTTWRIDADGLLPAKTISVDSPVFEVIP